MLPLGLAVNSCPLEPCVDFSAGETCREVARLVNRCNQICDSPGQHEDDGVSGRPGVYILQTFWVFADPIF